MGIRHLYIIAGITILVACKGKEVKKDPNTPRALQDKSIDVSVMSKRTHSDLLDNLYDELADQTAELNALEQSLEGLEKMRKDTVAAFSQYGEKNRLYYLAAAKHYNTIKDSTLWARIKGLVDSSAASYASQIAYHKSLLAGIDSANISLADLHVLLKIIRTLPMIEQYQKNNLPDSTSLANILQRYLQAIQLTDSLGQGRDTAAPPPSP